MVVKRKGLVNLKQTRSNSGRMLGFQRTQSNGQAAANYTKHYTLVVKLTRFEWDGKEKNAPPLHKTKSQGWAIHEPALSSQRASIAFADFRAHLAEECDNWNVEGGL